MLVILPSPISELQHAPLPPKCYEPGNVPQLFILPLFSPHTHIWVYQGAWEHVMRTLTTWLFLQQFKAWGKLHCPNPLRSKTWQNHISWMWTWCGKMGLGMEVKIRWQLKSHTSPMLVSLSFCKVNKGICKLKSNGTSSRICPLKKM
jgi:hypothetical protein